MTLEQWDQLGYAALAAFTLYGFADPDFPLCLILFSVLGVLVWGMRDPTK